MNYKVKNHTTLPELLIPASSPEVLQAAVRYGADAVYIGGEAFGLRAKAKNFSPEEMAQSIAYAHARGVKVHVTVNSLMHEADLDGTGADGALVEYLHLVEDAAQPGPEAAEKEAEPDVDVGDVRYAHEKGAAFDEALL